MGRSIHRWKSVLRRSLFLTRYSLERFHERTQTLGYVFQDPRAPHGHRQSCIPHVVILSHFLLALVPSLRSETPKHAMYYDTQGTVQYSFDLDLDTDHTDTGLDPSQHVWIIGESEACCHHLISKDSLNFVGPIEHAPSFSPGDIVPIPYRLKRAQMPRDTSGAPTTRTPCTSFA